jgi:hypothetical protein
MDWLDRIFDFDGDQAMSVGETFVEAFVVGLVAVLVVGFIRIAHLWIMN